MMILGKFFNKLLQLLSLTAFLKLHDKEAEISSKPTYNSHIFLKDANLLFLSLLGP